MLPVRKIAIRFIFLVLLSFGLQSADAQCSICTRTAEQMGEKPAKELNAGILYLAFTPLAIVGFIAFKWWKKNKGAQEEASA
jgi:hypothetical protein